MRQVFGARVAGALLFAFCAAFAGGALAQQIADAGRRRRRTPAPAPQVSNARSRSRSTTRRCGARSAPARRR